MKNPSGGLACLQCDKISHSQKEICLDGKVCSFFNCITSVACPSSWLTPLLHPCPRPSPSLCAISPVATALSLLFLALEVACYFTSVDPSPFAGLKVCDVLPFGRTVVKVLMTSIAGSSQVLYSCFLPTSWLLVKLGRAVNACGSALPSLPWNLLLPASPEQ